MSQPTEADVEVLEFQLGTETFCVEIKYVEEIVEQGTLTEVPNTPEYVLGMMDLRGRTTSIIDPTTVLDVPGDDTADRILVFDPDHLDGQGAIGWQIDRGDQVVTHDRDAIDQPTVAADDAVEGVIKQNDEFVIWVDPTQIGA